MRRRRYHIASREGKRKVGNDALDFSPRNLYYRLPMCVHRLAPIALFTYNRLASTQATVEALKQNAEAKESDLVVFSDGAKGEDNSKVAAVREYLKTVTGFRSVTVHESPCNKGIARSMIDGITQIVNDHGHVIVLEDDMLTSPYFLRYMNDALTLYEHDDAVAEINAFNEVPGMPETFFIRGGNWWGWGTWKRAWALFEHDGQKLLDELVARNLANEFNFDGTRDYTGMIQGIVGKNAACDILWFASTFLRGKLTLYPGRTLVQNIGFGADATHCRNSGGWTSPATREPVCVERIPLEEKREHRRTFAHQFSKRMDTFWLTKIKRHDTRKLIFFRCLTVSYVQRDRKISRLRMSLQSAWRASR